MLACDPGYPQVLRSPSLAVPWEMSGWLVMSSSTMTHAQTSAFTQQGA